MNKFNDLHGNEPTDPPQDWISEPRSYHFKYRNSYSNNIPVDSDIMGKLNHHAIDNVDVNVHTSDFPVEFNSESVLYSDTTTIKSIDDDEMYCLLEFYHSEHNEDLLDVDLQIVN